MTQRGAPAGEAAPHDWLFDALWALSDRSIEAGLPRLAACLEEAMDVYLEESGTACRPLFRSRRACRQGAVRRQGTCPQAHLRPGQQERLRRFLEARARP